MINKNIKTTILTAVIFIPGCFLFTNQRAQKQDAKLREVKHAGVSFYYNTADFAGVEVKNKPKKTAQDISAGVPVGIAPEHFRFNLKDKRPLPALKKGARYFYPTCSFICVIPLKDSSVKDFAGAYPGLHSAALHLRKTLRERPNKLKILEPVHDIPFNNAAQSILSKFQYVDFRSGSGILFLTQYSQEMKPNPVNNEELTLNFQGLTKAGRYYIAARLAITHPSLPAGIDFTGGIERDKQHLYLRKAEKELESMPEESFQPSLKSLKELLFSIHVE